MFGSRWFCIKFCVLLCFYIPSVAMSMPLEFGIFLGGNGDDRILSSVLTKESPPNLWVVGETKSTDFPLKNAIQTQLKGSQDIFIAKFNNSGALLFSTFFGGNGLDTCNSVALDNEGNIYITGFSDGLNFPIKSPTLSSVNDGDAFLSKFSPSGSLIFSFLIGQHSSDEGKSIVIDATNTIYLLGQTTGPSPFPGANPLAFKGGQDVFLSSFNSSGHLLSTQIFGGSQRENAGSVCLDHQNNLIIYGYTTSKDFPSTMEKWDPDALNAQQGFLIKLTTSGTLIFATLFAPLTFIEATSIAVDSANNIYVAGSTNKIWNSGLLQPLAVKKAAFIATFTSQGNATSTFFFGGSEFNRVGSIAVDANDNLWATGYTTAVSIAQAFAAGSQNRQAFLLQLNNKGSAEFFTTFGFTAQDDGHSIVVDDTGNVFISGETNTTALNITNGPLYLGVNAFISKFSSGTPLPTLSQTPVPQTPQTSALQTTPQTSITPSASAPLQTNPSDDQSSKPESSSNGNGAIIGGAVGGTLAGVALIAALILIFIFCSRRKRRDIPLASVEVGSARQLPSKLRKARVVVGNLYELIETIDYQEAAMLLEQTGVRLHAIQGSEMPVQVLGRGSFGEILLARNINTEQFVAVKVVAGARKVEESKKEDLIHSELSKKKLEGVMTFLDSMEFGEGSDVCLYQFMPVGLGNGQGLGTQLLRVEAPLKQSIMLDITKKLLIGVHNIHHIGQVVHLDLKPENVIYFHNGDIRITDFGCAQKAPKGFVDDGIGDSRYFSPERCEFHRKKDSKSVESVHLKLDGRKCDTFALGLTLLEIGLGRYPLDHCSVSEKLRNWDGATFERNFSKIEELQNPSGVWVIIFGLLSGQLTIETALEHAAMKLKIWTSDEDRKAAFRKLQEVPAPSSGILEPIEIKKNFYSSSSPSGYVN